MKTLLYAFIGATLLSSCTPKAQVVTLRGSNVKPAPGGLVLDNDTLTLRYNFSSERGQMSLSLVNKLDRPLYVDWKRSSFIIGQNKIDYWYDVADVNLSTWGSRYGRYTIGSTVGTIAKQDAVGFIPPQTRLDKQQFVIVPDGVLPLAGTPTIRKESSLANPDRKKPLDVAVYRYSADQSPLQFRNYLTLSTDKDFKTEFHIDTKFWASDVEVMPRGQLFAAPVRQYDGSYATEMPFVKPDGFYIPLPLEQ